MASIPHVETASEISVLGIKQESTQGTEATGDYRQLLVSSFTSTFNGDREGYKLIAGYKGAYAKNQAGRFVDVSFTIFAGSSDASQASLTDIIMMMLDVDTVTGSSPYTHTFAQETAVIPKKSWTLYHDDGNSNYRVFTGFVANEMTMTIDKTTGTVNVDVTGMAWTEADTTSKTVNLASNYNIYSPSTGKIEIGSDQINSWNPAVITLSTGAVAKMFLNDAETPAAIDGQTLNM